MRRLTALLIVSASVASASLGLASPALAVTTNFACTGNSTNFTVPSGITSLAYTVNGAGGGNGGSSDGSFWSTKNGGSGGNGASYAGKWTVTPGQVLTVKVGCKGNNGGNNQDNNGGANGGWGWFNGGKGGNAGGRGCAWWGCSNSPAGGGAGGGGASGISLGSLSVVAGGGGGGGGAAYWSNGNGSYGTSGNASLANGNNGDNAGGGNGGGGGAGGGGGNGGGTNGGSNGGNGGQNGRSAAGTDSALTSTYSADGGSGGGQDGSVSITYFSDYTFSGAPTGTVTSRSATLSFSTADANTTFECNIDGNGWGACSSPKLLAGAPDGNHSLAVRPKDSAGNTGPEKSASWSIDATAPPVPTISSKTLIGKTKIKSQAISFATTEQGSIYSCSIDGASYSTCTSPMTVSASGDGAHTFAVRASDSLGNTSDSTAVTWTVDGTAPVDRAGVDTNAPGAFLLSLASVDGGPGYPCAVMGATVDATTGSAYCDGPVGYNPSNPTFAFTAVGGADGLVKSTSGTQSSRTCGITAARTVRCGGQDLAYVNGSYTTIPVSTGDLPGISNAVQISGTGMSHYCVLMEGGSVKCFGIDAFGQVSGSARIIDMPMPQGVPSNGAKVLDNQNQIAPTSAPINTTSEPAIAVATGSAGGEGFSCALGNAGSVNCWGAQTCSFTSGMNPTVAGCTDSGPRPANKTVTGARSLAIGGGSSTTTSSDAVLCTAMTDDTVKCWGKNTFGTVGDGTVIDRSTPTTVTGLTGVKDVFVSNFTACALLKDGGVKCWGSGEGGTLGDGKGAFNDANGACSYISANNAGPGIVTYKVYCSKSPVAVTLPKKATDLTMGASTVCAKLEDRSLYCWGSSFPGSSYDKRLTPTKLDVQPAPPAPLIGVPEETSGTGSISFIGSDGASFKCAIDDATAASCTSPLAFNNLAGGLHTITVIASNAAGSSPAARVTWNVDATPPPAPTITRSLAGNALASTSKIAFTDSEAGVTYKCAVAKTGTYAPTWMATYGPCTSPYTASVAVGNDKWDVEARIIAVDKYGNESAYTPVRWTLDGTKTTTPSATANPMTAGDQPIEGFSSVSSNQSTCAATSAGSARCWGVGQYGGLGKGFPGTYPNIALDAAVELATGSDMTPDTGIAKLAVGGGWVCALSKTGVVRCWGLRSNGNLGDGYTNNSTSVSLASAADPVQGLPAGVTDIAAGNGATCAIAAGEVYCWGSLSSWKSATAAKVAGITTAVQVTVGTDYACARLADKTAKCWGYNNVGQLGISNSVDPQLGQSHNTDPQTVIKSVTTVGAQKTVTNLTDIRQISTGSNTACAIIGDAGNVWCWGDGSNAQTGDKTWQTPRWEPVQASGITGATKVTVGWDSACALLANGGVRCWGSNTYGQLGNGTTTGSANTISNTPVTPVGLSSGVSDLSLGIRTACAVLTSGQVKCWGSNSYGGVGSGLGAKDSTSISTSPATVLKAGPGLARVGVPRSPVRTKTLAVQFAGESGATFSCSLDGGTWADCTSPYSATNLDDDAHTLSVKQTVGGLTSKAETVSWVNDGFVEKPTIVGAPTRNVRYTDGGSLRLFGPALATFVCSIDGSDWAACSSTLNYGPGSGGASFISSSPGVHTLSVKSAIGDARSEAVTASWTSLGLPAKPVIVSAPPATTSKTTATIIATSEPGTTLVCVDGYTHEMTDCSSPITFSGLSTGSKMVYVSAKNEYYTGGSVQVEWSVVNPAPPVAPTLTGTPGSIVKTTSASIGFSSPTGQTYSCSVDGGAYSACTSPKSLADLNDGNHSLAVKAINEDGTSDAANASWTVDTTAPVKPKFTNPPSSQTNKATVNLTFTGEDGATFKCSPDGAPAFVCTSPRGTPQFADGAHTYSVTATDAAGNVSEPATVSWTVDTKAPARPTLTPAASGFTTSANGDQSGTIDGSSMDVSFTAEAGAKVECSITNSDWAPCASPVSVSGIEPGLTAWLQVRATDTAGNVDGWSSVFVTRKAAVAKPTITSAPNGIVTSRAATIAFSSVTAGVSYVCKLDGQSTSCGAGWTGTVGEGDHSFTAAASKGGVTTDAVSASWTVDTIAPAAPRISGVPDSPTKSKTASIRVSAETGASITCSVDSGAYAACASPKALSALSDGVHSISFKATDAAGNSSVAASSSWTVDATAPDAPALSGAPSGYSNLTSATIGFTAETGATVECSLDNGSWTACQSPVALSDLSEAAHSIRVRATDAAGNVSSIAKAEWTVDTTAPSLNVSGAPTGVVVSKTATITFTAESSATVDCKIDGGDWAACASPIELSDLAEGAHSVAVRATDEAGNKAVVLSDRWTVQAAKPDAPVLIGAPAAATPLKAARISFSGATGNTLRCAIDGASFGSCASPVSLSGLADGAHSVAVKQVTASGVQSDAATASWVVDTVAPIAPTITPLAPLASPTVLRSISWEWTSEAGSTVQYSLDGGAWTQSPASPSTLDGIATGSHVLQLRAIDAAGNTSASQTRTWQVLPSSGVPVVLTPADGTKTVVSLGVNKWSLLVGQLFSTGGDQRSAAQLNAVQVAIDSQLKSITTKPSDDAPAAGTKGVINWASSGVVSGQITGQPVWVRARNNGGFWTPWVKLNG